MGTKVQIENYLPGQSRESNGATWPSCYGDSNLSNGQFYYSFLPRTFADSHPGHDKDIVKQTMIEHEAIFKRQVYELHRLYRVQRDLMDEVRGKEQFKRRTPYETSSSSSPVPSHMQYEDVERWNGSNLPLSTSVCDRPPISVPDTVQSSPFSAKGKSMQACPSSLQNCYSPKNSEILESRPSNFRRQMLDLQLPADEYIDTDEVEQFDDVKNSETISPYPNRKGKSAAVNGKLFLNNPGKTQCLGDASRSDLHVSKPKALADLNEPLHMEEATTVSSVDFLRHGGSHSDVQYRDLSSRFSSSSKDVPQNSKNGSTNGTLSHLHFESRANGQDWFCYALESEHKGSIRSVNQGICREKAAVPSQPVHILLDQACQPSAFLTGDNVKGDPCKAKTGDNIGKFDRSYYPSSYNILEPIASHVANHPGLHHPSDLGKSWDQCASSWGKPSSFLGQKPISVQTNLYVTSVSVSKSPQSSAQSNDLFGNKWNLNSSPGANASFRSEVPGRNGFYQDSSAPLKGFDYVNCDYNDKTVPCSSINCFRTTSSTNVNPVKDVNLNVALPHSVSDHHVSQHGLKIIDKDPKPEDPLAVLPWLRGKGGCSNEAENSRKGLNSLESGLSRGPSIASNSCEVDTKAKKPESDSCPSSRKILGVLIFENQPTPKKENSAVVHKESEISGRKGGFDINVPCDLTDEDIVVVEKKMHTESASLRNHFDLNSCITEEEILSIPENSTSLKVDTGIDLEAPVVLENEEVILQDEDFLIKEPEKQVELPEAIANDGEAELAKSAAAAIVAISSSVNINQFEEETTCLQVDADLDDPLHWFVDIACTSGKENGDWLWEELDDFESMILRLKECSAEEYFPKPSFPEIPNAEESGLCLLTTTRTRKGQGRRGRQRRDFQRDILPGLASLSRHEVTEDLQMFGGLMRARGHPWHSGPNRRNATRSGCARGRRRTVAAAPAPANTICTPSQQQQLYSNNTEVGLEDRSLRGWGKTTRRARRQRHPAGNPIPPVPLT